MSSQFAKLAVVHWALIAGNNAYTLNRMYNELHDAEIHNLVGELREIQSHLNDLELWFHDPRITRLQPREANDMETGIAACTTSLGKLDEIVKSVTTLKRGEPTSRIWGEIKATFKPLEGPVLDRLNAHRIWLTQLFPILKMHFKPESRTELWRVREQIRYAQPPSPQYSPTGFVPISPWPAAQSPQSITPAAAPGGYFGYPSPPTSNSSTNSPSSQRPGFTIHYRPPARPEQPLRPTTPTDRRGNSAPPEDVSYRPVSRNSNRSSDKRARSRDRSSHNYNGRDRRQGSPDETPRREQPRSQCFGRQIDAGNLSLTTNEQEVMAVDFDSDMIVALYRNKETDAARIVCAVDHVGSWISDQRGGGPSQGSIKVIALTVKRESKYILNLMRSKHLWARLVFSDFENMILFFNTFLALRSHSPSPDGPVTISRSEIFLSGEVPKWDACVYYNDDIYRLHLLQDEGTRAVRIAAVIEVGKHEYDNMTIWTAFLHDQMAGRHEWFRQESATVILQRLPVYHFSIIFQPRNYGEFPIQFLNSHGQYLH
ncbi:hypothetical protein EV426DRAFT_235974 [Tirmania nivea]|nr:hypothetical protein EV426DRAFT_235974 [Tirmania nivea]